MNKSLRIIIIFLFSFNPVFAIEELGDWDYGLMIQSSPASNSQKTSLILENNLPVKLEKETSLSFDMLIRNEYMFGLILRILTNKNENIDLMLTVNGTQRYPILIVRELVLAISHGVSPGQSYPVSLTFSKTGNEIRWICDRDTLIIPYSLADVSDIRISFGTSVFEFFESSDIASVNVKDIRISQNGTLSRYWKLKEHQPDFVLDSVAGIPAIALNPRWIIDMRSTWKKIYSGKVLFNTQLAFDNRENFYLVSPDSKYINIFNTQNREEYVLPCKGGYIASTAPNTIFFDSLSNQLVTYNLDESLISKYSFDTHTWSLQTKPISDPYLNNSAVYLPAKHSLYSFGGYGYYKYGHALIKTDISNSEQKKTEIMEIAPRFSASTAIVGNTLYILGGRGSKSGRQEIAPRNFYDLYSVDLALEQTVKLWEEDSIQNDFLPGENMIYDALKNCFYVFTNQDGGNLLQIRTDRKGFEPVSFPVGENLEAPFLYTNLYYSHQQQKIFALIYKQVTDLPANNEIEISIFSLDYPPATVSSLMQIPLATDKQTENCRILIIGLTFVLLLIALGAFVRRKRRLKGKREAEKSEETHIDPESLPDETAKLWGKNHYNFSRSSICFLNGFNIMDKEGNNLKEQFTPTLKNLLILLILNTEKDNNGIFGDRLIQLLWFDKDKEAAKNSRNVYTSKLRSILENVGSVEILNKKGFWTIILHEDICCDYLEAMRLFTAIEAEDFKNPSQINKLLELLLRGVLLPNTEIDWLDHFKSDFSNITIDFLSRLFQKGKYQLDDQLRLKIADTIFLHDLINEEALYIKCSFLFHSGKKGIAKSIYNNFCKEYYRLLGISYKYSLTDVINRLN
jgi:two-component SAPR family response regulator